MTIQKGTIGVTTENIFPIIKKFLYSDHEIFLRELVSNAVDASQKLKTLSSVGDFKGEIGELKVQVSIDKEKGTLTISDRGIGMTADEIKKYINQIAFSGAEEFLTKYEKDANQIIGHFGLGFYSSFMVSKKVEIQTKSYKTDSEAVCWECDGSPEFTMKKIEKSDRGTDIILYIDDENQEFLEPNRIEGLLTKYCRFLPIAVTFGKEQEWKDGKSIETDKDKVVNKTEPEWTKKPTDLTDEDYLNFYRELYPNNDEPLFWIHLNVDYPFKLTGILYFPKIKNNDFNRDKIQLYCNQVFVNDSVDGIVPEFLTLLQGVIDSPDIPLNVSRSYLQSDSNVKKISGYITKKVADRLQEIFNSDRKQFEAKWDDIKIFIEYGMMTDDKFYEKAEKFVLLKNVDNQYFTLDEYRKLIVDNQTDKEGNLIYLYSTNKEQQYTYIDIAKSKGYDVLLLDGQLDNHFLGRLEQKMEKSRFVRVDSDVINNLILKEELQKSELTETQRSNLSIVFKSQIPKIEKSDFTIMFEPLGSDQQPMMITQNEFMRRMKEMSSFQQGFNFYGELPESFNLIVNTQNALCAKIIADLQEKHGAALDPLNHENNELNAQIEKLRKEQQNKKPEEISAESKQELSDAEAKFKEVNSKIETILVDYANQNKLTRQLVDLALLTNNMLKGEALNKFIKRSIELL